MQPCFSLIYVNSSHLYTNSFADILFYLNK